MSRNALALVLVGYLLLLPALGWASWSGKVVGVIDGDSITVLHDGRGEQIRLWGIDCPEKSQDFGSKAKHATAILVFATTVDVEPVTTDRYGRTVAFVRVGDTLLNEELIRQGLAWVFTRYCDRPICQEWKKLGAEAREKKRGLWSMPNPVAPWELRRQRRLQKEDCFEDFVLECRLVRAGSPYYFLGHLGQESYDDRDYLFHLYR